MQGMNRDSAYPLAAGGSFSKALPLYPGPGLVSSRRRHSKGRVHIDARATAPKPARKTAAHNSSGSLPYPTETGQGGGMLEQFGQYTQAALAPGLPAIQRQSSLYLRSSLEILIFSSKLTSYLSKACSTYILVSASTSHGVQNAPLQARKALSRNFNRSVSA